MHMNVLPSRRRKKGARARLNILTPLTGFYAFNAIRKRTRRIKYHRVCTTWYLFPFYFKMLALQRVDKCVLSECASVRKRKTRLRIVENFCMQKYHNFLCCDVTEGERPIDERASERTVYNRFSRKRNQRKWGDRRELSLKFILIRSPFQLCFTFFLCSDNSFLFLHRENCFHFQCT